MSAVPSNVKLATLFGPRSAEAVFATSVRRCGAVGLDEYIFCVRFVFADFPDTDKAFGSITVGGDLACFSGGLRPLT